MFKVIEGSQLKGSVMDADEEYFYGTGGRKTEEEYKQLLIDSQNYFNKIENGSLKIMDEYYIYAPEQYLNKENIKGIEIITNEPNGVDVQAVYIQNCVKVKPVKDGYVFNGHDGRHRFTVAQKYNLKLLVDIVQD